MYVITYVFVALLAWRGAILALTILLPSNGIKNIKPINKTI